MYLIPMTFTQVILRETFYTAFANLKAINRSPRRLWYLSITPVGTQPYSTKLRRCHNLSQQNSPSSFKTNTSPSKAIFLHTPMAQLTCSIKVHFYNSTLPICMHSQWSFLMWIMCSKPQLKLNSLLIAKDRLIYFKS